jgi:hypothetical protein
MPASLKASPFDVQQWLSPELVDAVCWLAAQKFWCIATV